MLFHSHRGQYTNLVFTFSYVEDVENYKNDASYHKDNEQEPSRHSAERVEGSETVFEGTDVG